MLALFPDGRPASSRWRPVVVLGVLAVVLNGVGTAFSPTSDEAFPSGVNPYAVAGPVFAGIATVGQVVWLASLLGSVASLAVRYRRGDAVERQQLKWLGYAVALLAVVGSAAIFTYHQDYTFVLVGIAVVVPLLPIAICVAILRYRLYDIDTLIARTLVYLALTAVLAVAYVTTALVLGAVLGGRGSTWVTAGATLAVTLAFLPARRRLQDVVDRRFRRARFDALARADTFLEDLRAGRAPVEDLEPLLQEILDRPELRVRYVRTDGPDPTAEGEFAGERTEVRRAGMLLALVEAPTTGGRDDGVPGLLDAVLARAGLAVEIGRLQAEVTHQLAQVQESRARIVATGFEERRRLQRDLHDGAQQRLVSVGLALRHAQHQLGESPVGGLLDLAVEEIAGAVQDLRELANGVRPVVLEEGLDAALRDLARRTPMNVQVHAGSESLPPDVAATAYFVACEALANAVKHSRADAVEVRSEREDSALVLTVRDDGVGGAEPTGGSGLRGLSDRVTAQGGAIALDSPAGAGTTIRMRLPCVF